jgi:hypothetical protein
MYNFPIIAQGTGKANSAVQDDGESVLSSSDYAIFIYFIIEQVSAGFLELLDVYCRIQFCVPTPQ